MTTFTKTTLAAVSSLMIIPGTARTASTFQGLGSAAQGSNIEAAAVSADGSTVVGRGPTDYSACRWTEEQGMVSLAGDPSRADSVSADGSVAVGDNNEQAVYWTPSGQVGLGDLPGGPDSSWATGVSADGSVIVGTGTTATHTEAFRWTAAGGMVGLGLLSGGGDNSSAEDVSADGSVIAGTSSSDTSRQAFRWTDSSGMVGLGYLSGDNVSSAYALSADGSVVVGRSNNCSGIFCFGSGHGFRWTESGGMVSLGTIFPLDVSGDGAIIVGTQDNQAMIWDTVNGTREFQAVLAALGLDLTDWNLTRIGGISDDGRTFVGEGIHNGTVEAWIAQIDAAPVPIPAAVWLFGSALTGLGIAGRRRPFRWSNARPVSP